MKFYANVNGAGLVVTATEIPDDAKPNPGFGLRPVAIDKATYVAILAAPRIDDALPAWRVDANDQVIAATDTRAVLTVTAPKFVDVGNAADLSFAYSDTSKQNLVIVVDGARVRLKLVNGLLSVSKVFPAGVHRIGSADPGIYRVVGGEFEVIENWKAA